MAETAMTSVLSKVAELASREVQELLKVGGDIMLLRDRLEWLQAFVRDADRKRRLGTDDFTQVLVRQTRDVAFEAEDTLDEFFHKVDIKTIHGDIQGWNILAKYLTGCTTQISVRHGLSGQIKRITSRLDQLTEHRKEYTVQNVAPGAWTSSITSVDPWVSKPRQPVGLGTTIQNLNKQLLGKESTNKLVYISVLGESGIGKSKLMDVVLSGKKLNAHFKVVIYSIMPPNSSVDGVVKQLLAEAEEKTEVPPAGEDNLSGRLGGKCYLVVLGGISSKSMLNCIKANFPEDNKGSRVVLILEPESEEVAMHAATTLNGDKDFRSIIKLSRLNESDTGDLLYATVYGDTKKKDDTNKKDDKKNTEEKDDNKGNSDVHVSNGATETQEQRYKRQIFEITAGLPLAVVVLSGLLRSKEKPVEWDAVLQQFMPAGGEASNDTDETLQGKDTPILLDALLHRLTPKPEVPKLSNRMAIERIFSASFDDLPHDLKTCFLYFAAFAKNTELDSATIVRMWAAEGFIKTEMGKTLEELGQQYLKELVSRCLLKVRGYRLGLGKITAVEVHSRLTRFLQSEAREASFIEVHDNTSVLAPGAVRRLSIQNDQGTAVRFGNRFPKLRSFICRVIDSRTDHKQDVSGNATPSAGPPPVEGCLQKKDKNASPIRFLYGSKFLRLLSISGVILTKLPDEICDMIHLRYLAVNCKELEKLPDRMDRLINLQTLDIRNSKVKSIAEDFWMIKTLRHVFAKQLKLSLPKGVQRLDNELQTLHGVQPAAQNNEVMKFPYFSQKVKEEKPPLELMPNLVSLELDLHGFESAGYEKALENLKLLQHLELKGDNIPTEVFLSGVHLQCLESLVIDGTCQLETAKSALIWKSLPNLVDFGLKNSKASSEN